MKYTFTCTPDGHVMAVEAKNDEAALKKLRKLGKKHVKKAHPQAQPMTDAEWDKEIKAGWKIG